MRAYEAVVFQFSVHTVDAQGAVPQHKEFLDVSGGDPRRAFAEWLIESVGDVGPVLVFSAYERTRIKELAILLPDLRDRLMQVCDGLVDLLPMARRGYYHPAMRGSWSLKAIVPTLQKGNGEDEYEELEDVTDGLAAQGAYSEMVNPAVIGPQKEALRKKMLRYCATDTQGLVRFVRYMETGVS
jgi:hypothetical protein